MKPIYITEDCVIYNDMPRGWISSKNQPKWHESLYKRWKAMWSRCKNPDDWRYDNYKDCTIDDKYRYLSKYIDDIMKLENFNKLCEEPSKWHIDKDKVDINNRCYFFEHLTIITKSDNSKERINRCGTLNSRKPIIGINIEDNSIIIFKYRNEAREMGFNPGAISLVCQGKHNSHKGYKWEYLDMNDRIKEV